MALALPSMPGRLALPQSPKEKLWLALGALAALIIVIIGYVGFIAPQRSSTDSVDSQIAAAKSENTALADKITSLDAEMKNFGTYRAQLKAAQLALPSTSGVPNFLRSLQSLSNETMTDVSSLTVGEPVAVVAPTTTGTTTSGTTTSGTTGTTGTTTTSSTGTSGTTTTGSTTGTVAAAPSAYSMTISAVVTGSPAGLDKFLDQLQGVQPRAVLVTNISEGAGTSTGTSGAPSTSAGATALQLTMQAFVAAPGS